MYKLKTLSSGLRVLLVPSRHTEVFTLLVLVGTGSKYETKRLNGISHFLEHMFFKGTKHRPSPGDVARTLDGLGAQHNAFTTQEVTGYWVKAAREHFDVSLDVVSDILTGPLLSSEEIEKERGVILQELRMRNDDPISRAGILFEELLWGDQPAGWWIIGSEKTIKGLGRDDFLQYFRTHYVVANTLVIVSGAYPANALHKINKAFLKLRRGSISKKRHTKDQQRVPALRVKQKGVEASNIILGFRAFSMHDPRRFALNMLGVILGGNSSARLPMKIREELGLAYYIRASASLYTDTGYFEISAGVPHHAVSRVVETIIDELRRIKEHGVTAAELRKAKDYIRGNTQIELEDSSALASFFGEQVLFEKKVLTPKALLQRMEAIRASDVWRVAKMILTPARTNLVVVGDNQKGSALTRILEKI